MLYRDKDYRAEAEYVHRRIQKHFPGASSILELGCGTAGHAPQLARLGYTLHGVDSSKEMIRKAEERLERAGNDIRARVSLSCGDIRSIRTERTYNAVISLFHVISYQTTNEDLMKSFSTAKAHLKPGGVFLFDCWYGPGVLTTRPSVRIKHLEDDQIRVTRIAEPDLNPEKNLVDVRYHVFIRYKLDGRFEEFKEIHTMRYLFTPEIEMILESLGFSLVESSEWLTDSHPGLESWNACFIARA